MTERVDARGPFNARRIERVEERKRAVKPREAKTMNLKKKREPQVELGGVWSEQAQLGLDRLKKPKTGLVWTGGLGPNRMKPGAGLDGDRSARLDRREYILELVLELIYEHSSTDNTCVSPFKDLYKSAL